MYTDYQNKFFAWYLDRNYSVSDKDKFTNTISAAKVDLNPHQIEAALFCFKTPFDKGAIIADEVGLGKTIEAGLVISQQWYSGKRKILVITPATLRKQWQNELEDKFFLKTLILEGVNFRKLKNKENQENPFLNESNIIICSYPFAAKQSSSLRKIPWDLVVMDEAHKLRNVYTGKNRTSNELKSALFNTKKILLTATPIQNSVRDLFGLISIIDEEYFGNLDAFLSQYSPVQLKKTEPYEDLKKRIAPIVHRMLRKDVQTYVHYTNRRAMVQEYYPTDEETKLYQLVNDYLHKEDSFGIRGQQGKMVEMALFKFLSSSTYAIAGAISTIKNRLISIVENNGQKVDIIDELSKDVDDFKINYTPFDQEDDMQDIDEDQEENIENGYNIQDLDKIKREIEDLVNIEKLAKSIEQNAKATHLITAIKKVFEEKGKRNEPQKALIFTESRKTQDYLFNHLTANGYEDKIVLFNGTNNDDLSNKIFSSWKELHAGDEYKNNSSSANKRQALVEYFASDKANIMIATEAACEGINLQFCSVIINYDLPWNPQRVEQRIGRCHRYGQKSDVVVVNFINKKNKADQRVYELLENKFKLFDGVFGTSDDILGRVNTDSFEQQVFNILHSCRTQEQIEEAFKKIEIENKDVIDQQTKQAQDDLINNFDQQVIDKLNIKYDTTKKILTLHQQILWNLTTSILKDYIENVDQNKHTFCLVKQPLFIEEHIPAAVYTLGSNPEHGKPYNINTDLAQEVIHYAKRLKTTKQVKIEFNYSDFKSNIALLDDKKGTEGILKIQIAHFVSPTDKQDYIISTALDNQGNELNKELTEKLMIVVADTIDNNFVVDDPSLLDTKLKEQLDNLEKDVRTKNKEFSMQQKEKIKKHGEDCKLNSQSEIANLQKQLEQKDEEIFNSDNDEEIGRIMEEQRAIHAKIKAKRKEIEKLEDDIFSDQQKQSSNIRIALKQQMSVEDLFTIGWKII